jgi:hypothetical protein
MDIRIATQNEYSQLAGLDHHISKAMMAHKISQGEVIVAIQHMVVIGWLRNAASSCIESQAIRTVEP